MKTGPYSMNSYFTKSLFLLIWLVYTLQKQRSMGNGKRNIYQWPLHTQQVAQGKEDCSPTFLDVFVRYFSYLKTGIH